METNELPALTGTEKQIAFATDIRRAAVTQRTLAEEALAEIAGLLPIGNQTINELTRAMTRTTDSVRWDNADAAYWIRSVRGMFGSINLDRDGIIAQATEPQNRHQTLRNIIRYYCGR